MNSCIFWEIALCTMLEIGRRFGGTCSPSLEQNNKLRNQCDICGKKVLFLFLLVSPLAYSVLLKIEAI
jgi:hypothetical protein